MADEACPMPTPATPQEQGPMQRMLAGQRIAVVGLSDDPLRASYHVAAYLLEHGKEIIPVNPNHATILGLTCYRSLEEVPGRIDVVNVFRRPEFCPAVVEDAVRVGARGVWIQAGIRSPEARKIAEEAGLDYIEDRCIMVEHARRM